ncbi:MAG: 3-oxoacyl-ACP synthase [Candidatus Latescibacteria bacterium]|nr:3-oxoacyl-ACP synthase [Candidatus Latescibacterota bacterium]
MKPPDKKELNAEELAALPDSQIDTSDIPELDAHFWVSAQVVMPQERRKTQVTAKFDREMVDWFKRQGRGYQARMNAVLRAYYEAHRDA